jgi:hypothetical protein
LSRLWLHDLIEFIQIGEPVMGDKPISGKDETNIFAPGTGTKEDVDETFPLAPRFIVGQDYRTYGGWKARVVWISDYSRAPYIPPGESRTRTMFVVHHPGDRLETDPLPHALTGWPYRSIVPRATHPVHCSSERDPATLKEPW